MTEKRNILIVGGGIIGLAIALELKLRGESVTVLCRDFAQAATHAAAGMLAPQAEMIPASPMLDLCLHSRSLYSAWIRKLETLTGLDAGYWACGILAPKYGDKYGDWQTAKPEDPHWIGREAIHTRQAGLSAEVGGGYWFPEDAQVDNRSLAKVLWVAAKELGIEIQTGVTVQAIHTSPTPEENGIQSVSATDTTNTRVTQLQTNQGIWQAEHYILATGAWSQDLLPVPVFPRKGQMLSVQVPLNAEQPLPLQQVLFGEEIYIVPRRDGRIVIGATSENVGFTGGNTPLGLHTLLSAAIRLYPALKQFPIQEFWWGFRPTTPDELPILGASPYSNLTLAIGHYRNGILLAPATGKAIAEFVLTNTSDGLLESFRWSRFAS
jgi:glycine oxidase ThiO